MDKKKLVERLSNDTYAIALHTVDIEARLDRLERLVKQIAEAGRHSGMILESRLWAVVDEFTDKE